MVGKPVTKRKIVYNFTHVTYLEESNSERQKVGQKKKKSRLVVVQGLGEEGK